MTKSESVKIRLYFVDAIRAWAILMMLQGHFIDGLLDNAFRNDGNLVFAVWKYFRGITAPVFFTVSGFIFTYLLIQVPQVGWHNPRVRKGAKRGLELLLIGYLLRLNIFGLFKGELYPSFYLVDVLHCIGLSILAIIGLYLLSAKLKKWIFPALLVGVTLILFLFEPWYKETSFVMLPQALANYFTKTGGSVFTIIPWLGYTTFGGFAAVLFNRYKTNNSLYPTAIGISSIAGLLLIFYSSDVFLAISDYTGIALLEAIFYNNYLFIRLGDVLVVFALFMLFRTWFTNKTLLRLGQSTLSIYILHFIILYGSFIGLGLYGFLHHSLAPIVVVPGALVFMIGCAYLALQYEDNKSELHIQLLTVFKKATKVVEHTAVNTAHTLKALGSRLAKLFGLIKN